MSIDVRELLDRAAVKPSTEPDVAALVRTARRRRTARAACAIAGAAAIVAVVVVAIVSVTGIDRRRVQTPLRPTPTTIPDLSQTHELEVTPSTGLRDRQIVRVSGRTRGQSVEVWICRAGASPATSVNDCDPSTLQQSRLPATRPSTAPLQRFPFMVRRTISLGGQPLDCSAAPGCVLYVAGYGKAGRDLYGVSPLAFNPVAPPLPGPSVTVTPPDALRDGDTISVHGRYFRPFDRASVTVCVSGTEVCDDVGVTGDTMRANGSFAVTHGPWSVFAAADGTPQDCRVVSCVVRVKTSDNVDVPVSFAPADASAYPRLTLDSAGPYTDGQQVTVTVQGWPGSIGHRPGLEIGNLELGVCAQIAGPGTTECGDKAVLQGPDAEGRYTTTVTLHRTLTVDVAGAQIDIDCAQPGNCRVALATKASPGTGMIPVSVVVLGADVVVN